MENEIYDVFDLVMNDSESQSKPTKHIPSDEALLSCLSKYGFVDMDYICELTGLSVETVIQELRGAIFQNPEEFLHGKKYSPYDGWELFPKYLGGNARNKLAVAERANKKFCGIFDANVEKLREILPERVDIDDIHITPGASWIPTEEISDFLMDFLNLKKAPEVHFYPDLLTYKIVATPECALSVLNNITYAVREDGGNGKTYLTAISIMEHTLNAKTIKVFDYFTTGSWSTGFEYEPVFNQAKTVEAQEKQRQIIDAFRDFVYSDRARITRFEQYYNDTLVGYTFTQYDGSFLKLSDLNPDIKLYKHQRDAVARVLLSESNLLLAHDVGTGKTYEMIVSVHELYRMGKSRKNLIVVPNNVLKATVDAHKLLYKNDKILAVYPKDFTPSKRRAVLDSIKHGDYTAIYMAYSSFDMIVMSKKYYIDKMTKEIKDLTAAAYNTPLKHEQSAINSRCDKLKKKLDKYITETLPCAWHCYDELGIDTLVVDEAHNYKNIPVATRAEGIVGMGSASKKCREMLEKAHYTPRLIFATGTPLTNSLADLFTFQTYLQPITLEYHRINTFDAWINTFGQRETTIECDVDSNSKNLRTMTRFSSFHNLSELMSLWSQVCDFHHMDSVEEGLPLFKGHTDICVPKNKAQSAYINSLSERTEDIRARRVKRNEDNLLKVTTDGRLAALDIRLVKSEQPYDGYSKTKADACAQTVMRIYRQYPDGVQVVFSDIGTPKAGFNIYDTLADKLVRLGMPREEIAYVHDASTESARARLFTAINKGTVRVVIGSTAKLGVGVNVQERLVALHHLSVPWRPADMVQREGRILRKGNTCEEIFMFRYITEGSFDAYSWQLLENKQRFISSFLSGTSAAREMDDIADAVLSYAEVKALAIGNPLIKKRVEVANELERTKIAFRSRQKEIQRLAALIDLCPARISRLKSLSRLADEDYAYYKSVKESVPNEERLAFGEELLEALLANMAKPDESLFDTYQGFDIVLPANMDDRRPYILIKSRRGGSYHCELELEGKKAMGCAKSIDYVLEHLEERAEKLSAECDYVRQQLREAREDIEKANPYAEKIKGLEHSLAKLDEMLEKGEKSA